MLPRLVIAAPLLAACLSAQPLSRVLTYFSAIDQSQQPYAVYTPAAFDAGRKYPLVLSLHSEDSDHRLNLAQFLGTTPRTGGLPAVANSPQREIPFIVACPLARGSMGFQGIAEQDVYDVLADVERRFPVDEDRVYLTGISMGGGAALRLAMTRPDLWAAVAPLAPDGFTPPEGFPGNLLDLPVRLYQGDADPIVPVASSRAWQKRLLESGVGVSYFEYPTVRHNVWDLVYRNGALLSWFEPLRRERTPEHVRFSTASYEYSAAYWVRLDSLTPGVLASVDAHRSANEIRVDTKNLEGFTLRGVAAGTRVIVDGAPLRTAPPRTASDLSFYRTLAGWRAGLAPASPKHAGAEGPMAAAVSSRHIFVYGTAGAATPEEIDARRKVAMEAAAWSTKRAHLALQLPVKADSEVTPDELASANLVLFGTAQSNAVIAKYASRLPLSLAPSAADYGLVYVFPLGAHYVLVNSGLPWWTGADDSTGAGYPLAPLQYRILAAFGDYVLFRGSVTRVIMEGRFDRDWKLPAEAAAKLASGGIVAIH